MSLLEHYWTKAEYWIKENKFDVKQDKIKSCAKELITTCLIKQNPDFFDCFDDLCINNEEKIDSIFLEESENSLTINILQTKSSSRGTDEVKLFLTFIQDHFVKNVDLPKNIHENITKCKKELKDAKEKMKKVIINAYFCTFVKKEDDERMNRMKNDFPDIIFYIKYYEDLENHAHYLWTDSEYKPNNPFKCNIRIVGGSGSNTHIHFSRGEVSGYNFAIYIPFWPDLPL